MVTNSARNSDYTTDSNRKGISGSTLKLIAIITMLIDHIGATVIYLGILEPHIRQSGMENFAMISRFNVELSTWLVIYEICRTIGRIAFPIFCYLLVEGFKYTKDIKKYALRLLLFAFISEIPFDLAFYNTVFEPGHQNVYFTLFLGILVLAGIKYFESKIGLGLLCVLAGGAAAQLLNSDYTFYGILLIAILYLYRNNKLLQTVLGCLSLIWELAAIIAFIPINLYNGTRGLKMKYFFYIFYPGHLLILYLITRLLL